MSDRPIWAVVPAAGIGARMQSAQPKQYLPLAGQPILLHTLKRLCTLPQLSGVVLGLAANDAGWPALAAEAASWPRFLGTYTGGAQRADTVLNGLKALDRARDDDWVLVHDAVRPCVRHEDIARLIRAVASGRDGGLLALPMADTVKRADANGLVVETVPRSGLWRALTPQMFRLGRLREALTQASREGVEITDEAAAIERLGDRPLVVAGQPDNLKITTPADLALAELYLARQEQEI